MDNYIGYIPFNCANLFDGTRRPSTVKVNSYAYNYWCRALTQRVLSIIEWKLPDRWQFAKDFFEYCLIARGFVAVFDAGDKYGVSFQPANLSGYDFYYQPTRALIANPVWSGDLEIGKETELIKLTPDYRGVLDIVGYYAEKLATLDGAVNMSIINSKLAYVLGAKNKASAQAIKMIFDKINAGEPTVVYDSKITESLGEDTPFEFLDRSSIKNSYITTDLLHDVQTIINQFDSEIGIPTLPIEKKERMINAEASAREADTSARVSLWDESLSRSVEAVNKMFGLDISYRFVFLDQMNSEEAEADDTDPAIKETLSKWGLV